MATKTKKGDESSHEEMQWPFGRNNYIMFGVSLVVLIIGYIVLGQGSITIAPILLVLGYCVLIPISLIIKSGEPDDEPSEADSAE